MLHLASHGNNVPCHIPSDGLVDRTRSGAKKRTRERSLPPGSRWPWGEPTVTLLPVGARDSQGVDTRACVRGHVCERGRKRERVMYIVEEVVCVYRVPVLRAGHLPTGEPMGAGPRLNPSPPYGPCGGCTGLSSGGRAKHSSQKPALCDKRFDGCLLFLFWRARTRNSTSVVVEQPRPHMYIHIHMYITQTHMSIMYIQRMRTGAVITQLVAKQTSSHLSHLYEPGARDRPNKLWQRIAA